MKTIDPPDSHHLRAAQGWIELGNHVEARRELGQITPAIRTHPAVLELGWLIYYAAKEWQACADIGAVLVEQAPERSDGWRHRAAPVHFMKRTREAYDLLFPALKKFPDDWSVHYDMACYACVLGDLKAAREWLARAFDLGEVTKLKLVALDDPDLALIWTGF
jgi:tetratricopeptide (TPR) repeat protein